MGERAPAISVVMATRNDARYLRQAVESVLGQTERHFEFVIVDDFSTDETPRILPEYAARDRRIRVVRNEKPRGLTASLNRGLSLARAELVARQDSDDVSLPERFAKQRAFLDTHPAVALVGCYYVRIDDEGRLLSRRPTALGRRPLRRTLLRHNVIAHGSMMFRRRAILEVGGYREFFRIGEDYDLILRVLDRYEIAMVPEVLFHYRLRSARTITSDSGEELLWCSRLAHRFRRERLRTGHDSCAAMAAAGRRFVPPRVSRRGRSLYHLRVGQEYVKEERLAEARREFARAIVRYPKHLRALGWFVMTLPGVRVVRALRWVSRRLRRERGDGG